MDTVRRRNPFKFSEEPGEEHDEQILDEQEQDEIVHSLREENLASNRIYLIALQTTLLLSFLLHTIYFFSPSGTSPLFALFPSDGSMDAIPFSKLLAIIALAIHVNVALILHRHQTYFADIPTFSLSLLFCVSAIAPSLCIFLGLAWQTFAWWCLQGCVVLLVKTVQDWIDWGNMSIIELEKLRYAAPGA